MPLCSPLHGLLSRRPSTTWENGFVTGNGTLGAIIFGQPEHEVVIGNDSRLFLPLKPESEKLPGEFDPLAARRFVPDIAHLLPEVRAIIRREGSPQGYVTAQARVWEEAKRQGYRGYQYAGNYHAGFKLHLEMPTDGPVVDYARTTDFATGEVVSAWQDDGGRLERKWFSSRPHDALVGVMSRTPGPVRFNPGQGGGLNASLHFGTFADLSLTALESSATLAGTTGGWLIQIARYDHGEAEGKGGYVSVIRVAARKGSVRVTDGGLHFDSPDAVMLFMKIRPFAWGETPPVDALQSEIEVLPRDYDQLLAAQAKVHGAMFARCSLDLGAGAEHDTPIEDLLDRGQKDGVYSPALSEKLYDVCRYAVISSTGLYPPGGKGLWIGQWQDEWNTIYTMDVNLELVTASVLSANLPELMQPLADFLMNERIMADCRENARKIFGARGIQVPQTRWPDCSVNIAWGPTISCGQHWTAGAAWFSSLFYDYVLYTGDRVFLRERLVPFMKEVAEFYEDYLTLEPSGIYCFSPAWSPENGLLAGAGDNPAMDIAACKELLTNLVASCRELGLHAAEIPRWEEMIRRLPPYVINADGALAEWALPGSVDNYSHRHASHLYPVWRSREITGATPELFRAARVATDRRIAAGGEDGSTHGFLILALTEAMLGNGNGAWAQFRRML
ncbi:MAG: glycoside hydrolase N-terminal domain-containing protein, partial [Opitutaceae bacterium]